MKSKTKDQGPEASDQVPPVKFAPLLFFEKFNPDETNKKVSLGRLGKQGSGFWRYLKVEDIIFYILCVYHYSLHDKKGNKRDVYDFMRFGGWGSNLKDMRVASQLNKSKNV